MSLVLGVVAAVVLVAVYLSWTAGRLDRLHARVDAAEAALDAQLVRRAAAARALAAALPPGPAASAVERAASAALEAPAQARPQREAELGAALAAAPVAGLPPAVRDELATAVHRVGLARAFHDAAVADALLVRRRLLVRALHLAGHRALPEPFALHASPPTRDLADSAGPGVPRRT